MKTVIQKFFTFATSIEKLKKIERFKGEYYWKDYPELLRYESVADHTWRLAMLIMLFADQLSQPFNTEKALKMALLHDLPEVLTGNPSPLGEDGTGKNTHAYNKQKEKEKHNKEATAAKKLFGQLPSGTKEELLHLWYEYETQHSFESQVVKAFDKIECLLQVLEYSNGIMFPEHLRFTLEYSLQHADVDPTIAAFGNFIAEELKKRFRRYRQHSYRQVS